MNGWIYEYLNRIDWHDVWTDPRLLIAAIPNAEIT